MLDHPLCRAVVDDPDDDHLRLIFADWMEECGDPRAEFIRLQIRRTGQGITPGG